MIDTHYIYRPETLPRGSFGLFINDVEKIVRIASSKTRLRGFDGTGDPVIGPASVVLNGDASTGDEHEPLVVEREFAGRLREGVGFAFCKTNGKPYDAAVVAVLYALIHRMPEARFTTDSGRDELVAGFDLFSRVVTDADRSLLDRPLVKT